MRIRHFTAGALALAVSFTFLASDIQAHEPGENEPQPLRTAPIRVRVTDERYETDVALPVLDVK